MDSAALMIRVTLSLAFIVGLMWIVTRAMRKSPMARSNGAIEIIARQQLDRKAGLALIKVGDRAVLVGFTEHQVTMLGEHDVPEMPAPLETRTTIDISESAGSDLDHAAQRATSHRRASDKSPLAGSVLSPTSWKQTVEAFREKTVRQ